MYDNWYAVQVRCGKEEKIVRACDILVDRHVLNECFIPRCKKKKKLEVNGILLMIFFLKVMFL